MPTGPGLSTSVRLTRVRRGDARPDPAAEHAIFQVSSFEGLLDRRYEGDCTLGELREHGDLGLGTTHQLDGELIGVDGEWWCARTGGRLERVANDERTPFAVAVPFRPTVGGELPACSSFAEMSDALDALPWTPDCAAVRIDGRFPRVSLRTVFRQEPPYPSMDEVAQQAERYAAVDVDGTVVGFRFPVALQGIEMPGYHLHFLSADRTVGGHVLDLEIAAGALARLDVANALVVEVPEGVPLPEPRTDEAHRARLHAIENG